MEVWEVEWGVYKCAMIDAEGAQLTARVIGMRDRVGGVSVD